MNLIASELPWAFGSPSERAQGGIMARLWMDSIFPYSTPSEPPDLPFWWKPDEPHAVGAYPGYQRNMRENSGNGEPNFSQNPVSATEPGRPFNMVILNTNGLTQSAEAPIRLHTSVDDEIVWPQQLKNAAGEPVGGGAYFLLELYEQRYLAPETRVIPVIPERDVMHVGLHPDFVKAGPLPDSGVGAAAIADFAYRALALLGDRLVGWFLLDEPDLLFFDKHLFATPAALSEVRRIIRQQEVAYANAMGIPVWHRPCIINFSGQWFDTPEAPQPEDFVFLSRSYSRALDLAMMDRYPWRILREQVPGCDENGDDLTSANLATGDAEFRSDPVLTAVMFRELLNRVNHGAIFGSRDFIPVLNFLQAHGAPYRMVVDSPSASREPAPPPEWEEGGFIKHARTLRKPNRHESRFEAWLSIFNGSEGLAYYMQPKVGDEIIWQQHRWVAHELEYFAGLRVQAPLLIEGENLTKAAIVRKHFSYGSDLGIEYAYMQPLVRIYRYLNPPSGAEVEYWMFLLNRGAGRLTLTLQMKYGVWRWDLQEYAFGVPVSAPIDLSQFPAPRKGEDRFVNLPHLPRHSFRLYKCLKMR